VLFFLVGLGWSFHVTFTLMMLLTVKQPEHRIAGVLFSVVVIYAMNLLTMALMVAALSHSVTFVPWLGRWAAISLPPMAGLSTSCGLVA